MKSRRLSLAVSSGLLCLAAPLGAHADEPPKEELSTSGRTKLAAVEQAAPGAPAATKPADTGNEQWEDAWLPWNTGEEFAGMGFAVFGHLGVGNRFDDPSTVSPETEIARNGLRVGATAIFRPIRWFGFGLGYEHADLAREQTDLTTADDVGESFSRTFRDLNTLWIDARAYPLRVDPFALYINIAGGPTWQSLEHTNTTIAVPGVADSNTKCASDYSAGMGMKAGVGAELALVSGAILWLEGGPDYYLLSEKALEGCEAGAGNAALIGMRAGFAIGFEKSKILKKQEEKPKDDDLDTIINEKDACPTVAGVPDPDPTKNGCPAAKDQDGDGIFDEVDACPTVAGIANADPKLNGCPLPKDKDNDGIVDDVDACPEIAGVKSDDPKLNGCPPDTDGDGFRDDQDGCPQEKGVDDADPTKRGCPKLVRVTATEIIILEQVQFDTGKATIKAVSDPLLDSVAAVMKEHPEILKIEVQGHTDSTGPKAVNTKLSDDRAKSVRDALVKRGVEANRFVAKGYGPDVPIGDNKTPEGKQKNRRVQFIVLEKAPPKAPAVTQPPPAVTQPPPAAPATPGNP